MENPNSPRMTRQATQDGVHSRAEASPIQAARRYCVGQQFRALPAHRPSPRALLRETRTSTWSNAISASESDRELSKYCRRASISNRRLPLPKPMTSGNKVKGRFVKADFRYLADKDVYICPAGERLVYHYTNQEKGLTLRRYWTNACQLRGPETNES